MQLLSRVIVSSLAVGLLGAVALAQDAPPAGRGEGGPPPRGAMGGGPRQMLSPEKAKAAWELQAKSVAKSLGLSEDQTKQTVTAYTEARQSYTTAAKKLRDDMMEKARQGDDADDSGQGRRDMAADMQKAMTELNKSERDKLQAALAKSLNQDQTNKAMEPLGTFNPQWDMMVDTVAGFKLDDAKNNEATAAMQTYVVALGKQRDNTDREAARTAMQDARKALNDSMKKVLTEEQFSQFQRTTAPGRGPAARGGDAEGARPGRGGEGKGGTGTGGGGQSNP